MIQGPVQSDFETRLIVDLERRNNYISACRICLYIHELTIEKFGEGCLKDTIDQMDIDNAKLDLRNGGHPLHINM